MRLICRIFGHRWLIWSIDNEAIGYQCARCNSMKTEKHPPHVLEYHAAMAKYRKEFEAVKRKYGVISEAAPSGGLED